MAAAITAGALVVTTVWAYAVGRWWSWLGRRAASSD